MRLEHTYRPIAAYRARLAVKNVNLPISAPLAHKDFIFNLQIVSFAHQIAYLAPQASIASDVIQVFTHKMGSVSLVR